MEYYLTLRIALMNTRWLGITKPNNGQLRLEPNNQPDKIHLKINIKTSTTEKHTLEHPILPSCLIYPREVALTQ